ncbi:dymeclin isoform X2 [Mangifera indica]|nr:dymeclin isoform X2 [Mangifera indica]
MGGVPSTPRFTDVRSQDTAEYLIATFVGEKSFPLDSDFWQKLLELPLSLRWPSHRVHQACQVFAQNNCNTRHLAKILIHLTQCLQESISSSGSQSTTYMKAINAVYISSVFLKYLIENAQSDKFDELHLSLAESEPIPKEFIIDQNIKNLVMHSVLSFMVLVDVSPQTNLLHQELLNFMLIAMSTQLLSGPSPGPKDVHPFIDAAMAEESSLVNSVVHRLLLNYIMRPYIPLNSASYSIFSEMNQPGVLQRVGSAAATFVLLPFNYLVSSSGEGSRNQLADCSLLVLLVLIHYRKCVESDESITDRSDDSAASDSLSKSNPLFSDNPYCKALENARDIEFGHVDIEGSAQNGLVVRLPFAALFDTLGMYLADETAVLLLYSLVQGNSSFLEYVLVRTDLDTLLMPILETLYNASKRTSNQIYMLLIILLILSQDSSFNASIHKMILPSVPWYKEHLLHQTSLGSLMVIILIRTVKYNLSKLRDVYLHTTCLATLANMAPHVHRLSAYASQRLVSLFYMLSRKYNKLADLRDDKTGSLEQDSLAEDMSAELHIYTDFLRIVLEILNAILTYALPRNPEVVYAILHRQEVFQPFKSHPRFNELLENIYTVLDFFNSRLDSQRVDGEWSVDKVLQFIIINCRSWRADGLKMFTQLHFSYEQESHPEEFFIPYVWRLVLSRC